MIITKNQIAKNRKKLSLDNKATTIKPSFIPSESLEKANNILNKAPALFLVY